MHRQIFTRILPLIFITTLSACSDNEDSSNTGINAEPLSSAQLTRKKCGSCHSLKGNSRKVGPPLEGIVGRIPKISGVPYATWDEKSLDEWIESPTRIKSRTTMAIPGVKSAEERAAIIEFLKHN